MDFLTIDPYPISNMYWHRKDAFLLAEDQYENWVMFAVTDGQFRFRIHNTEGVAMRGDLVICPPHTPFFREVVEPVSFYFYTFRWVNADCSPCDLTHQSVASSMPCKVSVRDGIRLTQAYDALSRLSDYISDARSLAITKHYFADLWKQCWLPSNLDVDGKRNATPIDPELQAAADWIREHAFGPLQLSCFSASKGWSPVQFTRKFHAAFGQTPSHYLTSLRLQKANRLLLETDGTLDEIAAACGYESGFYLSRLFSKKMKMSPTVYRKLHRL
ncbi:helix-turn-helix domain-containing protein [Paenibacillus sp. strain BS8-2]